MRKHGFLLLAMLGVMATTALPAQAVTWGGEVFGAFNTYAMDDWNDDINATNASDGTSFDEIGTGFGGGLGVRVWPNQNWMVAATWEPLFASTKDDLTGIEFGLNANAFLVTGAYFFPSETKARYGLGAGVGLYMLGGEFTAPGFPALDIEANGVGFHAMGLAEWEVSPGFAISAGAGYRMANLPDTELAGITTTTETDYSGVMVRGGLTFYMPTK